VNRETLGCFCYSKSMIKLIILDIGGVYLKGHAQTFFEQLQSVANTAIDQTTFFNHLNTTDNIELSLGHFAPTATDGTTAELISIWQHTWTIDQEMYQLVQNLKPHYTIVALSNSEKRNSDYYQSQGWYGQFDATFLSHVTKLYKPNQAAYQQVISHMGVAPDEAIFIDDTPKNIIGAAAVGIPGILFTSPDECCKQLEKFGISTYL